MKLRDDFIEECNNAINDAMQDLQKNTELTSNNLLYLKHWIFVIGYSLILTYHNTLVDALKEKGIDIGYLE